MPPLAEVNNTPWRFGKNVPHAFFYNTSFNFFDSVSFKQPHGTPTLSSQNESFLQHGAPC
jgi:hypothetical protein